MNIGDFILSGSPGSAKKKSTPQTSGPPVCCLPGPCAGLLCLQGTGEETPMVRPFMEILLFTLLKFLFMSRSLCFRWFWIVPAGFVEIIPSCMNLTWRTRQPILESRWQWRRPNTHTCSLCFFKFFFFFYQIHDLHSCLVRCWWPCCTQARTTSLLCMDSWSLDVSGCQIWHSFTQEHWLRYEPFTANTFVPINIVFFSCCYFIL